MKKALWAFIVITELIVIVVLCTKYLWKRSSILGSSVVSPIAKNTVNTSNPDGLKYFYEPKPNSDDSEARKIRFPNTKYTINNDSLNERYNYSIKKDSETFRIITLGDSFTYGLYVNTKDNWTELLEDRLNQKLSCKGIKKFEVINLGVQGYDDQYSVERYKLRGEKYNPDMIIWLQVDMLRIKELSKPKFEQITADASKSGVLEKEIANGKYYQEFFRARDDIVRDMGEDRVINYQINQIAQINNYYSGPVLLIPISEMKDKYISAIYNASQQLKHGAVMKLRDIYKNQGYIVGDGHPNLKGHQMIAEDIFNYLKSSKLISCK